VERACACTQVREQLFFSPRDRRGISGSQRRRDPPVDYGTGVDGVRFFTAQEIARRVTTCAVRKGLRQIGSAIPFAAF
jgi:hypothetical protein